jgi:hypothetical protein
LAKIKVLLLMTPFVCGDGIFLTGLVVDVVFAHIVV